MRDGMESTVKRRRRKTAAKPSRNGDTEHVSLESIQPSPENDLIYRPVDETDPEFIELAASIREHGILEPLIVTADEYIVSGHRRHAAAKLAGLDDRASSPVVDPTC